MEFCQRNRPDSRGLVPKCESGKDASDKIDEDMIWGKLRIRGRAESGQDGQTVDIEGQGHPG